MRLVHTSEGAANPRGTRKEEIAFAQSSAVSSLQLSRGLWREGRACSEPRRKPVWQITPCAEPRAPFLVQNWRFLPLPGPQKFAVWLRAGYSAPLQCYRFLGCNKHLAKTEVLWNMGCATCNTFKMQQGEKKVKLYSWIPITWHAKNYRHLCVVTQAGKHMVSRDFLSQQSLTPQETHVRFFTVFFFLSSLWAAGKRGYF